MTQVETTAIRSVYQPVVSLGTRAVVGYEALARGAAGSEHESPVALLRAAREQGRLPEVEWACRAAAVEGALRARLASPLTLFVNLEPEVMTSPPAAVRHLVERAGRELRVVVELTERSLAWRPADLLRTVAWVRSQGWGVAVDDVGADPLSLALMPLLEPDVVKLDLGLLRRRPDAPLAQVVAAVSAHAERTGATVLAEGVETEEHLRTALAMGATLGQGWLFGRPGDLAAPPPAPDRPVVMVRPRRPVAPRGSVFEDVAVGQVVQRSTKPLLQAMSQHLEGQALACGPMTVLLSSIEDARFFSPGTAARYQQVAARAALVAVLGKGMPVEPVQGVRGGLLDPDDPICPEWAVVVVSPHFTGALVARDLHDRGRAADRRFDYVLTYDRELVLRAATALLGRVVTGYPGAAVVLGAVPPPEDDAGLAAPPPLVGGAPDVDFRSAFENAPIGMAVLDTRGVVVRCNTALERLLGRPAEQVVGGDLFGVTHVEDRARAVAACRSLTGPGTVQIAVRFVHADGGVVPVTVTTSRVEADGDQPAQLVMHVEDAAAQRALEAELTHRALHDALTGLPNRGLFSDRLDHALARAARQARDTSVLFLDLDGFKAVNDTHGHHVGDLVLVEAAHRVQGLLRPGDTAARWGGDEFTVLCEGTSRAQADGIADRLRAALAVPMSVAGRSLVLHATIGTACAQDVPDGADGPGLLRAADAAMYALKGAGSPAPTTPAPRRA
ncbi:diguanylate cyclase domain-containing protein [uncultured Pseudokineococcus sp.]|uniref:diguanylate cyclase domain-containing protein n=1 Tax=uncultured Pseudokineococcus sp. TaxID=1642928 RepID=UPI0026223DF1|nr:diguanylate cyclase [uncultured Pseudokineococcus sp.]